VRKSILICSAILAFAAPAWAGPGDLKLSIGNGRVTLIADSVPVRTILQEWARLGQSQIVNGEKVLGGPVTLRLIDVPEAEALDVVLRSASGYLAAPRPVQMAQASQFDRIVILATSRPTTTASAPAPMPQPQMQPQMPPQFPANPAMSAPIVEDEDEPEEETPPNAPAQMPVTAARPGFVTPASPNGVQPMPAGQQPPQQPGQQPPVPVTSPRPGVIQPQQQPQTQPPPPPRPIPH
jgi:hypothetical protein